MYLTTAIVVNFLLRCGFATEATRPLAEARKQGTLELLLSTPLAIDDILRGHRMALLRQFAGPVMVVLSVEVAFMLATVNDTPAGEAPFAVFLYVFGMVMLVIDLIALYWVGMWQAMVAKDQSRALSGALARVLVLPWVVIALILVLAVVTSSRVGSSNSSELAFLVMWFVVGAAIDIGFATSAKRQLLLNFRVVAQQRFDRGERFWKRFLPGA
jgi:hypothetical protein